MNYDRKALTLQTKASPQPSPKGKGDSLSPTLSRGRGGQRRVSQLPFPSPLRGGVRGGVSITASPQPSPVGDGEVNG